MLDWNRKPTTSIYNACIIYKYNTSQKGKGSKIINSCACKKFNIFFFFSSMYTAHMKIIEEIIMNYEFNLKRI
jgi:hypothetical protein